MSNIINTDPVRKMKGVASTKFGRNGFTEGCRQIYHTDSLRFRKRAETNFGKAISYGAKSGWINVSNSVITAPPCEVTHA